MTHIIDKFLLKTITDIFSSPMGRRKKSTPNKLANYATLKSYQNIFERNKLKRPISINTQIQYSDFIQFGNSQSEVKEIMHSIPVEALFNTNNLNRHVLLFTEKRKGIEFQVEMHFHHNKLFFFKFLFPQADADLRSSLMKEIINSYSLPNVDLTLHSVYDNNNNCIQVRDLGTFEILHTSLNDPFFTKLIKELAKTSNQLLVDYHLTSAPIIKS